jgi:hypothetical protein
VNIESRPIGRSSILRHPDAKFSGGKGQERERSKKERKTKACGNCRASGNGGKIEKPKRFSRPFHRPGKLSAQSAARFPQLPQAR